MTMTTGEKIEANGATSFEIEIFEPSRLAGIYDVEIEFEPRAVATMRHETVNT